jgi:hypothetical protein
MFCKVVRMKKEIHEIDGGKLCGSKKKRLILIAENLLFFYSHISAEAPRMAASDSFK